MNKLVTVEPNRDNWRDFCEEPALTEAEVQRWYSVCAILREDHELAERIMDATADEHAATTGIKRTSDWNDVVQSADAHRRLKRATLKAMDSALEQLELL